MVITHSDKHRWEKPVLADPLEHFGKKSQAKLRSTLNKINATDIRTEIVPLTEEFFEWFTPRYIEAIGDKDNPKVHDVYGTTLGKETKKEYFSMALYEGDDILGGAIFSVYEKRFSVAYRIYDYAWRRAKLPAAPSLYTEYVINKHAYETGMSIFSHGKDRNPYGLNANIGLAGFKLQVGCKPYTPNEFEVCTLDTSTLSSDALVLELPSEGTLITRAYLIITKENEAKYEQLLKYPDLLPIEVMYR